MPPFEVIHIQGRIIWRPCKSTVRHDAPGWWWMRRPGLRGRGVVQVSTGVKWGGRPLAVSEDGRKFMVCGVDEVSRRIHGQISRRRPLTAHIEGMMLGGYAIGASKGYVCARGVSDCGGAFWQCYIDQARKAGILGEISWEAASPFRSGTYRRRRVCLR